MRKSIKVLIALWLGLLLIVGILFYNAYSRLRPESMVTLLKEQVQKNYPGSKLEIEKFDYSPSVDFNIIFKNLVLKRDEIVLGKLGEIEFRIPWWLLIFNRGKAQINVSDLVIYIDESTQATSVSAIGHGPSKVSFDVPKYFQATQFTLRAQNISIRELKTSRNLFRLSKLLVREFQYGKNSAFELKIPINLGHRGLVYSSELWLFGDVTPQPREWILNYRGEFRTRDTAEKMQFEDIIINGKTKFSPDVVDLHSELDLSVEKNPVGKGTLKANETEFYLELNLTKLPVAFLDLFETEFRNPYLKNWEGNAQGPIHIRKSLKENKMVYDGNLTFPGKFYLDEKEAIQGQWRLMVDGTVWQSSFISPKAEVSYFRRSVIDLPLRKIGQFSEELGFTGMEFQTAVKSLPILENHIEGQTLSYFSSKIAFKNCTWGEKKVDGQLEYGSSPDKKTYGLNLQIDEGHSLNLNFEQSGQDKKLDALLVKFPWFEQFKFLLPYIHAQNGTFDGKVEGRWKDRWELGQWLMNFKIIDVVGITGTIPDFNRILWSQFGIDSSTYTSQDWNASVRNGVIKFDSFTLLGPDPVKMVGALDSTKKQKSFLTVSNPGNKKIKPIKKEITEIFWRKE